MCGLASQTHDMPKPHVSAPPAANMGLMITVSSIVPRRGTINTPVPSPPAMPRFLDGGWWECARRSALVAVHPLVDSGIDDGHGDQVNDVAHGSVDAGEVNGLVQANLDGADYLSLIHI